MHSRLALISLTLALAVITANAHADLTIRTPATITARAYIGVNLGYATAALDQDTTSTWIQTSTSPGIPTQEAINKHSMKLNAQGIKSEIFVGYGFIIHRHLYLGAELFGNLSTTHGQTTNTHSYTVNPFTNPTTYTDYDSIRYAIKSNYGISLIPGWQLTKKLMIYGRIGYVRAHLDIDGNSNETSNDISTIDINGIVSGYQLGLGTDLSLTAHIDIRGEFIFSKYGSISKTVTSSYKVVSPPLRGSSSERLKIGLESSSFNIGLYYRFVL